jgi:hypothetical protein
VLLQHPRRVVVRQLERRWRCIRCNLPGLNDNLANRPTYSSQILNAVHRGGTVLHAMKLERFQSEAYLMPFELI